jgi:hypothetical protein
MGCPVRAFLVQPVLGPIVHSGRGSQYSPLCHDLLDEQQREPQRQLLGQGGCETLLNLKMERAWQRARRLSVLVQFRPVPFLLGHCMG